jgi:hypothetical protein
MNKICPWEMFYYVLAQFQNAFRRFHKTGWMRMYMVKCKELTTFLPGLCRRVCEIFQSQENLLYVYIPHPRI